MALSTSLRKVEKCRGVFARSAWSSPHENKRTKKSEPSNSIAKAFRNKSERGNVSAHEEDEAEGGVAEQQADWHTAHVLCTLKTAAEKNSHQAATFTRWI